MRPVDAMRIKTTRGRTRIADMRGSIIDVMEAPQRLPEHEQAASLRQLFGDETVGAVAPLPGNLDNLPRAFESVGDQASYAGAMRAEYEGVANRTAARLVVFRNYMSRLSPCDTAIHRRVPDVQGGDTGVPLTITRASIALCGLGKRHQAEHRCAWRHRSYRRGPEHRERRGCGGAASCWAIGSSCHPAS